MLFNSKWRVEQAFIYICLQIQFCRNGFYIRTGAVLMFTMLKCLIQRNIVSIFHEHSTQLTETLYLFMKVYIHV